MACKSRSRLQAICREERMPCASSPGIIFQTRSCAGNERAHDPALFPPVLSDHTSAGDPSSWRTNRISREIMGV
jgi:hypothetical protein